MNRSARETSHDLSCPNCVATMRHVATLAKFAVHPELRNLPLRCLRACGNPSPWSFGRRRLVDLAREKPP